MKKVALISIVAIVLYILFFSHSPPYWLHQWLGNVYIAGTVLAVCVYITLYSNRTIGVLLLLAFLITMSRVTEHLEQPISKDPTVDKGVQDVPMAPMPVPAPAPMPVPAPDPAPTAPPSTAPPPLPACKLEPFAPF